MMLYPAMNKLTSYVPNRYMLVNVVARRARQIAEAAEEAGEQPLHREGYRGGTWVLLDYGCIAIHVFNQEARAFYGLERLWQDGKSVDLSGVIDEHE